MDFRESSIQQAADKLRAGCPVIFPTDTVYGLGLSVLHASSPQELYLIKGRASDKPVAWLVDGPESLSMFGRNVPDYAFDLARTYWPGPLTVIVSAAESVPVEFQSSQGSIGMRMPDNQTALSLIRQAGCPLATTSANISGTPAVSNFEHLDRSLLQKVGVAVLDSSSKSGTSSTVVDCTGPAPVVLREGSITEKEIIDFIRRQQ